MNGSKRFFRGFGYAFEGLAATLRTQRNMKFHAFAAVAAILVSCYARLQAGQWLWVLLSIALVWSAELMNTAVEHAVDLASPERSELAKLAKDAAAASVLVAAAFALAVAAIVLFPAVWQRWSG
jgi:undecaprenol kinase